MEHINTANFYVRTCHTRNARVFIWGNSRQKQEKMAAPRGMCSANNHRINTPMVVRTNIDAIPAACVKQHASIKEHTSA